MLIYKIELIFIKVHRVYSSYSNIERIFGNNLRDRNPTFLLRKQKLVEMCDDLNNLFSKAEGLNLIPSMIDCPGPAW